MSRHRCLRIPLWSFLVAPQPVLPCPTSKCCSVDRRQAEQPWLCQCLVPLREPFNSISHMVGAGFALAALPLLVLAAKGPLAVVSASVYGSCLLAVFVMSAVFHGVTARGASEIG